ncbi:hypothetical protein [Alcanivorax sp. DP30]|uniref:hypothetical protein n=1 Tax=Alcanivorax sp. DP30 TaxID=2606217 RepID=UPI00136B0810|nr:hypothetical protein [Alcanivorax sp. DP30]MZR63813.1 hypothetical protein [Alcanivorax sp. DP30]
MSEMIKIREFKRRVWGANGTPLTNQAIRDQIQRDVLPGAQIGRLWFIDWDAYQKQTGNALADAVLRAG